jgi:hypothetical protein
MAQVKPRREMVTGLSKEALAGALPSRPPGRSNPGKITRMAQAPASRNALVIDYQILNANTNSFIFRGDQTYWVTAQVILTSNSVIEAGTCVKFSNSVSALLWFKGPIDCQTTLGRPAIFTSQADNSVGEVITTNALSGYYGLIHLFLDYTNAPFDLHDLHIRYAQQGLRAANNTTLTLSHCQIVNCNRAFANYGCSATWRNVLLYNLNEGIYRAAAAAVDRAEHLTGHKIKTLLNSGTNTLYLTNSLLISVTNGIAYVGSHVHTNIDDTGYFQTVGGGLHYCSVS